jgi:ATP-binding cassette subfamily B protein
VTATKAPPAPLRSERSSLRYVVKNQATAVAALALASILGGALEAAFLVIVTRTTFAVSENRSDVDTFAGATATVTVALTLALGVVILRIIASVAGSWQSAQLSSRLVASIRNQLASAFLRASWDAQHQNRSGRLQELLTTYAQQGTVLGNALGNAVTAGFSLSALLVSAIFVDPKASLALIAGVTVLAIILRPIRTAIRNQARAAASTGMTFATSLNEISQLGLEMHIFGIQAQTEQRVHRLVAANEATTRRLRFLQGLLPAMYTGLAYLAVIGAVAAISAMNPSDLGSIGAVMLIMLRSLSYGQGLQAASANINSTLPFLNSLDHELQRFQRAELRPGPRDVTSARAIKLNEVDFGYTLDTPVLRGLSLEIGPNEIVGVIGPSGSGKSTLVQLLLGIRQPTSGSLTVDGHSLNLLNRIQWVRKVTFVPQDAHLVEGTVEDNIRFYREWVTKEAIQGAAELANLSVDLEAWDEGIYRQVGSQGSMLSGGQKQRLIIARALVESPDLLILDEPTSSLDVGSEALIRATLNGLRDDMTILIVAHRLSTLDICDRIMVMQDGKVVAFDTPENLRTSSDFYKRSLELSGLEQ